MEINAGDKKKQRRKKRKRELNREARTEKGRKVARERVGKPNGASLDFVLRFFVFFRAATGSVSCEAALNYCKAR